MSRTVFILGAGASAFAGAPLMTTFIAAANEVRRSGKLSADEVASFDLVFRARSQLQSVYSKALLDINNVESLFGAFEMAALLGSLGNLAAADVDRLPQSIIQLIARTIELRVQYRFGESGDRGLPRIKPPQPYEEFVELVTALLQSANNPCLITFNYDLALDYALHYAGVPVNYCLEEQTTQGLPLLKLHGSLNWGRCRQCSKIVPWQFQDWFRNKVILRSQEEAFTTVSLSNVLESHSCKSCGLPLQKQPMIVPPTWNKGKYRSELMNVWRTAAGHLSEAENIVVIGYSLPPTDEFFRYFYALGSVGDTVLERVCIVNPEEQAAIASKKIA